jgi:hypothetical protein
VENDTGAIFAAFTLMSTVRRTAPADAGRVSGRFTDVRAVGSGSADPTAAGGSA